MPNTRTIPEKGPQIVHYHAHGGGGFRFPCYSKALGEHLASVHEGPHPTLEGWTRKQFTTQEPRRHTDLRKVTCPACWRGIRALAKVALEGLALEGRL